MKPSLQTLTQVNQHLWSCCYGTSALSSLKQFLEYVVSFNMASGGYVNCKNVSGAT